ncbi:isochorismatase family protein [Mycobacterium sp. CBMA293]|uniref:isochorismatase family protein n=1 Tax=unclassified Mycolicibacterium TaxID=2636767 RepID=UPI0012DDC204|nr:MULTISPECIES: isochorismatase family protein [unclassified Mycolicibacterium]MUL48276.1 isochorismatase family protein [Mycolicibacterium sp. CBMA 360]MUL57557.1 isochorismatase family protein [Mycolicibacterium sp. CBMA 335]MUL70597.1 isochorismatase family protein [Mycolicibacterium sp. CBMA 311]MUL92645.1 isochorismatase family protein [Mycolicibacterium sp. CBMA 230]MUM08342.1 hydrolase [Mycolicibacterium sp. CBMA 213]
MPLTSLDRNPALVLIDLQKSVVQAAPLGPVIERAAHLATTFRHRGFTTVLVQLAHDHGAFPPGHDDFLEELGRQSDDVIVTKRNWGAFYGTDLDLQLRRRGVTQIVLGGVATSIGVESTARCAHERGYHLVLATDAMADLDPDAHRHSITKIFPRIGETTTTAEVLTALAAPTKP